MDFCLLILIAVVYDSWKWLTFCLEDTLECPDSLQAHTAVRHGHQLVVAGGCGGSVGCLASTEGAICFTLGDDQWILRFASVMFGVSILRIFVGHRSLDLGCLDFLVNEEAFERNVLTTCYITVTLLKLDFFLRFHIMSSKLTRFKRKSCLLFVPGLQTQGRGRRDKACFSIWINWGFPCVWRLVHAPVRPQRYLCGWPYVYVWWLPGHRLSFKSRKTPILDGSKYG